MTDCGFLELGALDGEDQVVVAPLEDLGKQDHLFVLKKIKRALSKVERVLLEQSCNFTSELRHH